MWIRISLMRIRLRLEELTKNKNPIQILMLKKFINMLCKKLLFMWLNKNVSKMYFKKCDIMVISGRFFCEFPMILNDTDPTRSGSTYLV